MSGCADDKVGFSKAWHGNSAGQAEAGPHTQRMLYGCFLQCVLAAAAVRMFLGSNMLLKVHKQQARCMLLALHWLQLWELIWRLLVHCCRVSLVSRVVAAVAAFVPHLLLLCSSLRCCSWWCSMQRSSDRLSTYAVFCWSAQHSGRQCSSPGDTWKLRFQSSAS